MINVFITYDDNDSELGDYFEISFKDIKNALSQIDNLEVKSIRGLDCTENNVIEMISSFEDSPFVFVGLSHGNDSQLITENDVYVDMNNLSYFNKSLFYSTACNSAVKLGKELIENRCYSYVGFNQVTYATHDEFYNIYTKCENYCLKDFLSSNNTIEESFNKMLAYFDEQIHLLNDESDEILVLMELTDNRDSFVLLGNKELKMTDFQ